MCGVVSMPTAEPWLVALCAREGADSLPWLSNWGVADEGTWVHSLGVAFLFQLGQRLGYASLAEVPTPRDGTYAATKGDVRCDAVWFDRTSADPFVLAEFERYDGVEATLRDKAENLLLAWHRWGRRAPHLLLAYWTAGAVQHPDHSKLQRVVRDGFQDREGRIVRGSLSVSLSIVQFSFSRGEGGRLRLAAVDRRGGS